MILIALSMTAHPMSQHIGRYASVADDADVSAGVATAERSERMANHRMERTFVGVGIAGGRVHQEGAAVLLEHQIVGDLARRTALATGDSGNAVVLVRRVAERMAHRIGAVPHNVQLVDER